MMTFAEIQQEIAKMTFPSWIVSIRPSDNTFNTHYLVKRSYCLLVDLGYQADLYYENANSRAILSNHAFHFPADLTELKVQVTAAITMAFAHEIIEFVSDGGKTFCDPHRYTYGNPLCDLEKDYQQWINLDDAFQKVISDYVQAMPPK